MRQTPAYMLFLTDTPLSCLHSTLSIKIHSDKRDTNDGGKPQGPHGWQYLGIALWHFGLFFNWFKIKISPVDIPSSLPPSLRKNSGKKLKGAPEIESYLTICYVPLV